MEFPHTITVFRKKDDGTYIKKDISGVMWYGSQGLALNGNGIIESNSINIIIPKENVPSDFKIDKGCRIVKGLVNDIKETITELNNYDNVITVKSVTIYDFNSQLDGILIVGE